MSGESKKTKDHKVIKQWVEDRGGWPAAVADTGSKSDPGMLRIDFPEYSGGNGLEKISWDNFFKKFDQKGLTFLYQDSTSSGDQSRFCKFIHEE